jgi:hypothetical protein
MYFLNVHVFNVKQGRVKSDLRHTRPLTALPATTENSEIVIICFLFQPQYKVEFDDERFCLTYFQQEETILIFL